MWIRLFRGARASGLHSDPSSKGDAIPNPISSRLFLATELLIGFLFAIAILIPIYVAIAMATLALDLPDYASAIGGLALFVVFGEFARYRARRYRLTRTVFRGLRFHQDGSGWLYALYAILCLAAYTDWHAFDAADLDDAKAGPIIVMANDLVARLGTKNVSALAIGGISASILVAIVLYPVFQAIVYRWWLSGLRFGGIAVTSRLRIGQVYLIYLRYIGLAWLFMMGASIGIGILAAVVFALLNAVHIAGSQIPGRELIGAGIGVLFYAAFALGLSVMHQVLITFALWCAAVQSAEISDAPILDTVEAKAGLSSALGEGLVDALGFGSV